MDATTTAIFAATGVASSTLTNFLNTMFSQGISFMLYVFGLMVPYLLVIGLIGMIIGLVYVVINLFRRA